MQYTTVEDIARRLRGRLNISETLPTDANITQALGYGNVVAGNTVDPELITQIADEKEAYIDLILSQIYVTPLRLTSTITFNILRDISESLTISSLIQVHFEGTSPVLQASDASQASMDLRRHGEYLLQALSAGHNIWIPTAPPLDQSTPQGQRQPLRLPGEVLLPMGGLPDTITRNYSVSGKRDFSQTDTYFDYQKEDCLVCNSVRGNKPFGVEPDKKC